MGRLGKRWVLKQKKASKVLWFGSVQFSCSVVPNSLPPHGLQKTRLPCPAPTPRAYSNSCPLSRCCHPTISSCRPLLLLPLIFPSIRILSNESALLEKETATHSSILAWRIPRKEEPGRLQSMGSKDSDTTE